MMSGKREHSSSPKRFRWRAQTSRCFWSSAAAVAAAACAVSERATASLTACFACDRDKYFAWHQPHVV